MELPAVISAPLIKSRLVILLISSVALFVRYVAVLILGQLECGEVVHRYGHKLSRRQFPFQYSRNRFFDI
jgi:hypothetical protein